MTRLMQKLTYGAAFLIGMLMKGCFAPAPLPAQTDGYHTQAREYAAQGHTAYYTPLTEYQVWWEQMEKCAGVENALSDWKFVVVDADAFILAEDTLNRKEVGATLISNHRLYYIRANIGTRERVQHEMLHAMLYAAGVPWEHRTIADSVFSRCNYL